jgi:hypothetical protein
MLDWKMQFLWLVNQPTKITDVLDCHIRENIITSEATFLIRQMSDSTLLRLRTVTLGMELRLRRGTPWPAGVCLPG